jgi:hypothetical protein
MRLHINIRDAYKMCIGTNYVYGGDIRVAVGEICKLPMSVNFVFGDCHSSTDCSSWSSCNMLLNGPNDALL